MTEPESHEDEWDSEEQRIWRRKRDAIQQRVTAEDFAIFTQQLEQIEARLVGKEAGEPEGEADKFIFSPMRSIYYMGYMSGLDATERE